jgi:hypothetical protein
MRFSKKIFVLIWLQITLFPLSVMAQPTILAKLDFEDGLIPNVSGCSFGSQDGGSVEVSKTTADNLNKSKGSLKGSYPVASGGIYVWGGCDIATHKIYDVYIDFYAKMPKPTKQGLKFLKVFGQRTASTGYANTTIGLDYTGVDSGMGSLYAVSFGDGTDKENDTQNVAFLDGSNPSWVGRSNATAQFQTKQGPWAASAWGDGWHHFRIHVKFNTGNSAATEKADGEYSVEINGKVYLDIKNIFNRHHGNLPIEKISFFDWAQGGSVPFEIWYDDIVISTGGFVQNDRPRPVSPQ